MGMVFEAGKYNRSTSIQHVWRPYNCQWHENRGIFAAVPVWVFLSMRVEGMISCVDGMFLSILLNNSFLLSRVFPRSWGFVWFVDQNICVFMCE